jgi:hypothetical protein
MKKNVTGAKGKISAEEFDQLADSRAFLRQTGYRC